jgi:hypothetical protein
MEPNQPLPAPQPAASSGLVLDGEPTTELTLGQQNQIAKAASMLTAFLSEIVDYLAADPVGYTLTTAELTAAATQIGALQKAFVPIELVCKQPNYARIALALITDSAVSTDVAERLHVRRRYPMSGMHARAILAYLGSWPDFAERLTGEFGVRIRIVPRIDSAYGDACYLNGELLLKASSLVSPYGYLRLFLHEVGHATFEPRVLNGTTLPVAVAQASGPVDGSIAVVSKVGPDARDLYKAWLTLRQDAGKYLVGLDLGPGMSPAQRRSYQARDFGEFCAEVFMQLATGELTGQVQALQRAGLPQPALNAWAAVIKILPAYRQQILGEPAAK